VSHYLFMAPPCFCVSLPLYEVKEFRVAVSGAEIPPTSGIFLWIQETPTDEAMESHSDRNSDVKLLRYRR
jgi:hypothetical protein